jgi:ankyrin repeat protein
MLMVFAVTFFAICPVYAEDVNARDKDGYTPLHRAAQKGDTANVEDLIEKVPSSRGNGSTSMTPRSWRRP